MNARNLLLAALVAFGLTQAASATVIPSPSNDIALQSNGGVAYSSLGSGSYDGNHGPAKLNDGNEDGNYGGNPIGLYHSASNAGGYVGVTLNGLYDITSINLFTRTDCCGSRIDTDSNNNSVPFTAEVLKNGVVEWSSNYTFISAGNNISITIPNGDSPNGDASASGRIMMLPAGGIVGNDVRIIQNNADYINLAEVEAFGQHVPEPSSMILCGLGAVGLFFAARRRRLQTVLACCLAVVCLTHAASAATITWDTPAPISGPSDVARAGKLFDSIMFSSNNANASATVNGVTFDRATTTGGGTLDSVLGHISTSEDNDQITNAPTTGNASYNALLSDESYNLPASPHNITLNGLGIGNTYLVQAWADDSTQNNPPQNSLSLNFGKADAVIVPNGDYIIGHFTADASTQVLTWGGSSAFYSTIDALQVQQLTPEPSSFVLGGLAAIGMLMAARRRRKVCGSASPASKNSLRVEPGAFSCAE